MSLILSKTSFVLALIVIAKPIKGELMVQQKNMKGVNVDLRSHSVFTTNERTRYLLLGSEQVHIHVYKLSVMNEKSLGKSMMSTPCIYAVSMCELFSKRRIYCFKS
jgi:hypothetical protein